ncbi:hypothetical protein Lal_00024608 [Lupinus albus]|nr:hypothetical protein Lal_00024608 [Lupinus albus]
MPTDEHLQRRGCHLASRCSNCHTQVETSKHLFLSCSFVVKLWGWLAGILNTYIDTSSIESIFSICNDQWSPQAISRIKAATSLSGNSSKLMTINSVSNFVILRQFSVKQNFQRAPRIKEVIWLAPLYGWIKINFDGAAQEAPGLAGGGGIFRDYQSAYLGDSLFAELKAAYHKGWRNIWLECDSALVVSIFNGERQGSLEVREYVASLFVVVVFDVFQSLPYL